MEVSPNVNEFFTTSVGLTSLNSLIKLKRGSENTVPIHQHKGLNVLGIFWQIKNLNNSLNNVFK